MSGHTVAEGRLKADVFEMLPSYAAVTTGCREPITRIHTEVIQAPAKMEANEQGLLTRGPVKERWLLTMCGREEAVIVTFTPNGGGGSYISFSRKE